MSDTHEFRHDLGPRRLPAGVPRVVEARAVTVFASVAAADLSPAPQASSDAGTGIRRRWPGPSAAEPLRRRPPTGRMQLRGRRGDRPNGTYEEYHPFGSTSWWATKSGTQVSSKRYRYTGKEKDEETGLGYHGARFYAPWLGRWASADPAGMVDGPNRYRYVRGNPVGGRDPTGLWTNLILASVGMELERAGIKYEDASWREIGSALTKVLLVDPAVAASEPANAPGPDTVLEAPTGLEPVFFALSTAPTAISARSAAGGAARVAGTTATAIREAAQELGELGPALARATDEAIVKGASEGVEALRPELAIPARRKGYLHNDFDPHSPGERDFLVTVGPDRGSHVYADGVMVDEGVLVTNIQSEGARAMGHSDASGGFAFQSMVEAAEATGELRTIRGTWIEGDNLAAFRAAGGRKGATEAVNTAAARSTWTAQQAAKAGFTEIQVERVTDGLVRVNFTRPGG